MITQGDVNGILLAEFVFAILAACVTGPLPAALAEIFPSFVRYTAIALAYNIAFTLFGGSTEFVAVGLKYNSWSCHLTVSLFVILTSLVSLIIMIKIPETHKR